MKKLFLIPLAAAVVAVSCSPKVYSTQNAASDEQADGGTYTERTVPVVTKIAPDATVTLRFYDDMPDVAYISAADFHSIVIPGSTLAVTYTGNGQYTLANGDATATVNIKDDVFVSDQFEAFTNQMGLLQPGMPNVYYDGMPFVRYKSITYLPAKATTTLDFGAYGIDIRSDGKGTVYFPFATLADMYTDLYYHHAGFNGEKVVANLSVNEVDLSKIDPDYNAPIIARETRPADLAEFTYKELCFAMDHFYGYPGRIKYNDALKTKGLDKTLEEDIECGPAIKKLLLSENLPDYMLGMTGLTGVYFDGHTAMDITSSLGEAVDHPELAQKFQATVAANQDVVMLVMSAIQMMRSMIADQEAVSLLRPKSYGEGVTYVKKGDTAVCIFDSFNSRNEKAWKDYYAGNGPMPTVDNTENDDMIIFLDALNKAAADPEVKNLIIDISKNGGGSADIVMAMTALIMGKSYISQDNSLTGQRAIVEYEVDRNFNRVFDAADEDVHYDLNFAVLTSGTSFSCGNLFPAMLKESGIPVIGATSGGGACAIQAMCTADGFCFQISSFRARLNTLDGENIDSGVTPTIPIPVDGTIDIQVSDDQTVSVKDYTKFFDIDYLKALMEETK
ncbi:MAG: hypothetical protein IKV62_02715 [Bacteroidales bacterium]|nr:hypothetical protein [Bacteroidales bacterium]